MGVSDLDSSTCESSKPNTSTEHRAILLPLHPGLEQPWAMQLDPLTASWLLFDRARHLAYIAVSATIL